MKRRTIATIIIICLLLLPTSFVSYAMQTDMPVVRIGVFEPQTGDNAAGGRQEILGMQYANFVTPTVEIGGKEYQVVLEYADNQSANDRAPAAAQMLIAKGCSVVLGSHGSGVTIAAAGTFAEAGIPVIGASCTNPAVTYMSDYHFRVCFLDPFQSPVLAHFARDELKAKKAYCLAKLGDDYSVGLCNFFREAFGDDNCRYETFQEGMTDFSIYIENAKAYGADVFFSPVSTEAATLIIDQACAQELGMPILAGDTWDSNFVLNAARGRDIKIFVTAFYQEGGTPAFDNGFKAWINGDATAKANNGGDDRIAAVSAMGCDAYHVALEALKKAGSTDPARVRDALGGVTYNGVTGQIAFDDLGDAIRDSTFVKTCNTKTGKWEFVKQQGISTTISKGVAPASPYFTAPTAPAVSVSIDGKHVKFTELSGQPFIDENSRTQVPFRIVLEAFGADVDWDSANKTAIAVKGGITVKVPIGTDYIYKNGAKVMNDTKSLIKDNRTYLPIRIVLEAFGADVDWDSGTKTVVVKSKEASEQSKLAAEVAANMRNLKSCDFDEVHVYDFQISDEKISFTISRKGNLFYDPPKAKVVRTRSLKGDNTITETYWLAEDDKYMKYTLSEDGWSKEYDAAVDLIILGHLGELLAKFEAKGTDKVSGASVTKFEGKITYGEYLETFLLETEDDDVDFLSIDVPFTLWVDTESKLLVKYSCDFKNYLLAYLGAEYYGEPGKVNKCYLESVFSNFNNATDFKLPKGIPYQR
ncbi:MAG: ABC transporter substrate-binding protein [Clostridiales bacterium]|nr:ABC transporter substrate-binding protein [Clostridiales bacterium]